MPRHSAWLFVAALSLLALKGLAFDGDFNLEDALVDAPTKPPAPKPKPPRGPSAGSSDLDLSDYFDTPVDRKTTTKAPRLTTTKAPKRKPQPKPQPVNPNEFDLADALDDKNDRKKDNNGDKGTGSRDDNNPSGGGKSGGGSISDKDLEDILDDGYSPDRKKGGGGNVPSDDPGYGDSTAETGTIAGIASAIGMALVGVVTSYISYQKKKLCFSIQESLNSAQYVKGQHLEAVVAEEPQAQQTLLQSPSTDPTSQDAARV
ncbi:CD99 antigen-like protein 2 isoform X1 [Polyodon spathula]|uniref:CD99 antigen-like protein 2 isoform X1 n=1 Tax=Polyodon spathula TaxID=7913 RepID=UPI001B7EA03A|nr:CD99 antigen-like protein 2 isoform X1 [Polyodon spathula]